MSTKRIDPKVITNTLQILFEQSLPDGFCFSDYRYCVAIDLGGGNSSAAGMSLEGDQKFGAALLKLGARDETSLWATIGYDGLSGEEGAVSIGKMANHRTYRYSGYKTVPTDANLEILVSPDNYASSGDPEKDIAVCRTVRELTCDYIRALFERAMDHTKNIALRKVPLSQIVVVVGHPSSDEWKQAEANQNLIRIVKEAIGVDAVLTNSESNSAILYALKILTGNSVASASEDKVPMIGDADKVLIVDLGAFSADLTFIDRGSLEHKYTSIPLGARSVDKNIGDIIIEKSGVDPANLAPSYNLAYESRSVKEEFWPDGTQQRVSYVHKANQKKEIEVSLSPECFDRAANEMAFEVLNNETGVEATLSYTGHLKKFLEDAKETLRLDQVDFILVTGGAARMAPAMKCIHQTAAELWNVPAERIWPDKINAFMLDESVPVGSLCFVQKAAEIVDELPTVYDDLFDKAGSMLPFIANQIGSNVADYVIREIITPCATAFSSAETNYSGDDLMRWISMELEGQKEAPVGEEQKQAEKKDHKKEIKAIVNDAVASTAGEYKQDFQSIITKFLKKLYGRTAKEAKWSKTIGIDVELKFDKVFYDVIHERATASIGDMILGAIGVVLAPVIFAAAVLEAILDTLEDWIHRTFSNEEELKAYEADLAAREKVTAEKAKKKAAKEEIKKQKEMAKPRRKGKREKIANDLTSDTTKSKVYAELREKVDEDLQTEFEADGFGIPAAFIDQLAIDICNAVYTGLSRREPHADDQIH